MLNMLHVFVEKPVEVFQDCNTCLLSCTKGQKAQGDGEEKTEVKTDDPNAQDAAKAQGKTGALSNQLLARWFLF